MSDIYEDLKARASEHGVVPAFRLAKGDPPGQVTSVFVGLVMEDDRPGFARLVIHESPEPPTVQYLVEVERLRAHRRTGMSRAAPGPRGLPNAPSGRCSGFDARPRKVVGSPLPGTSGPRTERRQAEHRPLTVVSLRLSAEVEPGRPALGAQGWLPARGDREARAWASPTAPLGGLPDAPVLLRWRCVRLRAVAAAFPSRPLGEHYAGGDLPARAKCPRADASEATTGGAAAEE